jgi:hypothetical protein
MEVLNDNGSAYMTNGQSFFIGSSPFFFLSLTATNAQQYFRLFRP